MFYVFYMFNWCLNIKVMMVKEGKKLIFIKWIVDVIREYDVKFKMYVFLVIDYNILLFEYFELIYFKK